MPYFSSCLVFTDDGNVSFVVRLYRCCKYICYLIRIAVIQKHYVPYNII